MPRRLLVAAWTLVLAVAAAVRAAPLLAARPYIAYIDEGNLLRPIAALLRRGGWDPHWYMYPELPVTLIAAASRAIGMRGHQLVMALPTGEAYYDVLEPFKLLLIGRLLSLAAGVALVALTGWLARRLAGEAAGLFALALAALTPALAIRGAIAVVDPLAAFFAVAALTAILGRSRRAAFLAGTFAGCAFASKYGAVLVMVGIGITTLAQPATPWREKLGRLALATAGLAAGVALAMPAAVVRGRAVLQALFDQSMIYATWETTPTLARQALVRAEWDLPYDHPELGWGLCACAAAGWVLGLRDRRLRPAVAGWIAFAAVTVAVFAGKPFQPFRNMLPLVPLTVLGAALFFAWLRGRARRPRLMDLAALVALCSLGWPLCRYAIERATALDSRHQAVEWLRAHAAGSVAVERDIAFMPSELVRIGRPVTLEPYPTPATADMVVTSVPALPGYRLRARFGYQGVERNPAYWHGNGQLVYIFERR